MNHLDRILVFIVLFSISGTLITSYLSNEYNTHTIGHKELNNLHNISNIDISEYNAYLYTNDTEIPEFKYFIGNQDLFNVYLKNVTTETNIIYTNKKNIYKSILSNLPTILFLYFIIKSLNSQMKLYSGSFNDNINKIAVKIVAQINKGNRLCVKPFAPILIIVVKKFIDPAKEAAPVAEKPAEKPAFKKFNNNNEHVNKTHAFTCRLYDFIFCQSHASHASRA